MRRSLVLLMLAATAIVCACQVRAEQRTPSRQVGDRCGNCEELYDQMPEELSWMARIAPPSEPGQPLEVSGIVYKRDGRTPAPNVILYAYHTDARGYYRRLGVRGPRHRLRGWVKTNRSGNYKFLTIRPGAYPNATDPAHIHVIVKEPDANEYWIDDFMFDDDPRLTPARRARFDRRGGSGVIHLEKNAEGRWVGRRDIILGLNVPNYE